MRKIAFVNYIENQCGIHQYGWNLYESLKLLEPKCEVKLLNVQSFEQANQAIQKEGINYAFYNSPMHMTNSHLNAGRVDRNRTNIYVVHDTASFPQIKMGEDNFYQYTVMGDPTLVPPNERYIPIKRVIWDYENKFPTPEIVTIGSFGFNSPAKGFAGLINRVQEEFDEAIIRLNIPASDIGRETPEIINKKDAILFDLVKKKGVQLKITHDFLETNELFDFLAQNSLNAFLYQQQDNSQLGGIASSLDVALSARRPMAISKCSMFRHVLKYNLPITVPEYSLKEILDRGADVLDPIYREWSKEQVSKEFLNLFKKIEESK